MALKLPTIYTRQLKLRPFVIEDSPIVQGLAGDPQISSTLPEVPQPYNDGVAEQWITTHRAAATHERAVTLAITRREDNLLIGAAELRLNRRHGQAELICWIGRPYWDQGFATEAARGLVRFGFTTLNLHRISARHLARNQPAGKMLRKIGMSAEGFRRQSIRVNDVYEDEVEYGMTKAEVPEVSWKAAFSIAYEPQTVGANS